jgi:hypothetical protein
MQKPQNVKPQVPLQVILNFFGDTKTFTMAQSNAALCMPNIKREENLSS